ncbi:peptidase inhibitor family I36 [Streptomyces sp. 1114.5]|uniref:peptidase inhibitor family I36 protein n=1 Tax=unclassified Streptomyces TaxID=2593676 RepID=UPI000BD4FBFE|nr:MULTISPECIES: peptidase inhibitor family I36 protein [unclassified Streptomyces]RKT19448.1 peptidase inhibitor family I36 [Streptomyces sp. 1114.5]SOB85644.1 Peptidase inhibitor family I36 [Streptomyces sp. 1331.2]
MKRIASIGIVAAAVAATLGVTTNSAYAAGPGGSEACPSGSICLYYNSPQYGWGAFEHWSPGGYGDLGEFTFSNWGNGSGYGVSVGGHAASVVNNTGNQLTIYNGTWGHGSVVGYIGPGYAGVLPNGLYNAEWSMYN